VHCVVVCLLACLPACPSVCLRAAYLPACVCALVDPALGRAFDQGAAWIDQEADCCFGGLHATCAVRLHDLVISAPCHWGCSPGRLKSRKQSWRSTARTPKRTPTHRRRTIGHGDCRYGERSRETALDGAATEEGAEHVR
jgi:hypothetical protein